MALRLWPTAGLCLSPPAKRLGCWHAIIAISNVISKAQVPLNEDRPFKLPSRWRGWGPPLSWTNRSDFGLTTRSIIQCGLTREPGGAVSTGRPKTGSLRIGRAVNHHGPSDGRISVKDSVAHHRPGGPHAYDGFHPRRQEVPPTHDRYSQR